VLAIAEKKRGDDCDAIVVTIVCFARHDPANEI
jgi:hypothetical protein